MGKWSKSYLKFEHHVFEKILTDLSVSYSRKSFVVVIPSDLQIDLEVEIV